MRLKQGDLVRFRAYDGQWAPLWNKTGIVLSNPKEKPFQLSPKILSLTLVVDVLVGDEVFADVLIDVLEKKISN